MTDYRSRELTARLTECLRRMPVVVLSGLRQSGKSTLLTEESSLQARTYHSLDDFAVMAAAQREPQSLVGDAQHVTLDEVQRCPELLTAIKTAVDSARKSGRFLLSGSANLQLLARVTETLAGRAVYLTLHPMTRREIHRRTRAAPALVSLLKEGHPPDSRAIEPVTPAEVLIGGLPPVCLEDPGGAPIWFRGYEQTYIERDVRQLSQIGDLVSFRTLVQLAALRTGRVLNVSQLGRDAKLTAQTANRYLHLLEATFLIHRVPPFLRNRSSRLIKSPKLYCTDSGLAGHLAGVQTDDLHSHDPMWGALLETYIVQNIAAILEAHASEARLSFWHEQGRHEVDLVIEHGRRVVAIEIKAGTQWSRSDLAGLETFVERTPQCHAAVLAYNGMKTVALGDKLWAMPLGSLIA